MSNVGRNILSIIEPDFNKIRLDEIFFEDSESEESKKTGLTDTVKYKTSSIEGAVIPTIFVNSIKFDELEIQYMELNLTQKIPSISITIEDSKNKLAISAPLDGDVISLYLRPPDTDNQKPIRIDFTVVNITGNPENLIYTFFGEMKIPEFFADVCKSFGNSTSFNHLLDVCEDLGLGFASNDSDTDDGMTRICAFDSYETFINETVSSAYKNDDSFFDWYIDPFYYLCFINVNKQFSLEDSTEEINISHSVPISSGYDMGDVSEGIKGSLVLTNMSSYAGTNLFIESFTPSNNSGSIWTKNGYLRYAQWLNVGVEDIEYQSVFVDPLTTPGAENDFILLKGRKSDGNEYKNQKRFKWLGKQSSNLDDGNVHPNYKFSKVLNYQNLEEINKTVLKVDLSGMNFYISKYMRVPVLIYETNNIFNKEALKNRNRSLGESVENTEDIKDSVQDKINPNRLGDPPNTEEVSHESDQEKNEFLSGYYVVKDIKYIYYQGETIKTKLTLSRREWPIPGKVKNN